MTEITIKAELLFTLESKQDWINRVPRCLPVKQRHNEEFLWIDANGCVLETGKDFSAAERLWSFPVRVYRTILVSTFESEGNHEK